MATPHHHVHVLLLYVVLPIHMQRLRTHCNRRRFAFDLTNFSPLKPEPLAINEHGRQQRSPQSTKEAHSFGIHNQAGVPLQRAPHLRRPTSSRGRHSRLECLSRRQCSIAWTSTAVQVSVAVAGCRVATALRGHMAPAALAVCHHLPTTKVSRESVPFFRYT